MERIPVKPRVTCPVYYKVTYERPKRAEQTSFINSKPGRQIGKRCQSAGYRKRCSCLKLRTKVRDILLPLLLFICVTFKKNSLLTEITDFVFIESVHFFLSVIYFSMLGIDAGKWKALLTLVDAVN